MAPRKAASPAKPRRVTRARAADPDTNINTEPPSKGRSAKTEAIPTTSRVKATEAKSRVTKKPDTTTVKAAKGGRATSRAAKSVLLEQSIESDHDGADEITVAVPEPSKTSRSSSRNASKAPALTSSLAAAPRRRIRVTPLDAGSKESAPATQPEEKPDKKTATKDKKGKATAPRSQRDAAVAKLGKEKDEEGDTDMKGPETKRRGRARTTTLEEVEATAKPSAAAPKSRGRPKKEKTSAELVEEAKPAPVTTRQTRARAGSASSSVAAESNITVVVPTKKKVTFEALPGDDDEKENKRPTTISKSKTVKATTTTAKNTESEAKGMRAKPIRKPTTTRSTKATRGASTKTKLGSVAETEAEESEKPTPRALTPKKVTQVAKAVPVESEEDEEDELAGAKTPVRDLSLSPKRGLNLYVTRPMSPVKKPDFTQTFTGSLEKPDALGILSPPRRMPASPFKDSLKESPRRAPEGFTVFRAQLLDSHNAGPLALNPSNSHAHLLQSPKRGPADHTIFPSSAIKSQKSPLKTSLLSSPARRLFSPSKQKTPARISPSPKKSSVDQKTTPVSEGGTKSPGNVDLAMSSHFRSSVSPQRFARVYRLSEDELAQEVAGDLDFDQSVLNIRSPLKLAKVKPVLDDAPENVEPDTPATQSDISEADNEETILDPAVELEGSSDGEETAAVVEPSAICTHELPLTRQSPEKSVNKPRMSGVLFSRLRHVDDESEDELAGDQTPDNRILKPLFRPSLSAANIRSRLSTGVVPASASKNLGFTPLAAQVQGWRAVSPGKKAQPKTQSRGLFSPVAQMHIAGSVELNRQDTPVREAQKRKSLASRLSFAPSMTESPARPDFFAESMAAQDFDDQSESQDEAVPEEEEDLHHLIQQDDSAQAAPEIDSQDVESQCEVSEDEETEQLDAEPGDLTTDLIKFTKASDTAMVDFKALANEAEELAAEEEDLEKAASEGAVENQQASESEAVVPIPVLENVDEEQSMLSTSSGSYGDENTAPLDEVTTEILPERAIEAHAIQENLDNIGLMTCEAEEHGEDEGMSSHDEVHNASVESVDGHPQQVEATTPASMKAKSTSIDDAIEEMDFNVTPIRPDPSLPRYVNTVVSKVPLRPEGKIPATVSPIKVQRKRPRSLSPSDALNVKRRSLEFGSFAPVPIPDPLATPQANSDFGMSPQRRIRSAAPSPANSLATGMTTPGQMSFAIDDFGDSTLDGIELPDDVLLSDDVENDFDSDEETRRLNHDESMMTIGSTLFKTPSTTSKTVGLGPATGDRDESMMTIGSTLFKTPAATSKRVSIAPSTAKSKATTTPGLAMSTKSTKSHGNATPAPTPSRVAVTAGRTPATANRAKTPSTSLKSKTPAKTTQTSRTPLKPVGQGVLHGAVVHTDIHTSEGMDASAFYIDLLTSMGARVVKEWRWNPRASITADSVADPNQQAETPSAGVGITHVVYKDGGKRTLEKVRSAKGQVLCVGVGWVLDCVREGQWLDESAYAVDSSIMPRGGSRRRKSMEPRMLINENGLLSASRENRRSLSAEYAALTEEMKMELINTPVRGKEGLESTENGVGDETEISSTYDSPTAATVGGGGETANLGYLLSAQDTEGDTDAEISKTPGSTATKRANMSTPQSTPLAVDYDPRTAATPLTPYLVAKGREMVQMSAPAKQINKGIFERDGDGDSVLEKDKDKEEGHGKKFQVKVNKKRGLLDARRKTLAMGANLGPGLGFKPVVGSPLRKE